MSLCPAFVPPLSRLRRPAVPCRTPGAAHPSTPSSAAWVVGTAGLLCGGEVVKDLIRRANTMRIDLTQDPDNAYAKVAAIKAAAHDEEYSKMKE